MPDFLSFIDEVLWGSAMIYLLLDAGYWFAWCIGFVQFRYIRRFDKSLKNSINPQPGGLISFQALCISLAVRVGSGNLAGVTLTTVVGGVGAILWMWVSAVIGVAISLAECSFVQLYKERGSKGRFRGGPTWYMAHGLGTRWVDVLFAIFLPIAYDLTFNSIQANSVSRTLDFAFDIPPPFFDVILAIASLMVIVGSIEDIARLTQWFVPMMVLLWIGCSFVICLWHLGQLPGIIMTIIRSAFDWQEAAADAAGYTLSQATANGLQRGVFSNEAGMGSTPNVAASAASWSPRPAAQDTAQVIGVLGDTLILCAASVMITLLAGSGTTYVPMEGIQLLQRAMVSLTGERGVGFVAFIMVLFAFDSIVANYIYMEDDLAFSRLDNMRAIWLLRIATVSTVVGGTLVSLPLVWRLADIVIARMAITNLTAILLPSPVIHTTANDYLRQRKLGVRPEFDPRRYPDIRQQLVPDSWDEAPREQCGNRNH